MRREEDGEDEHHNGMDDDYDYDDKDEDDNDGDDDDNFGDNDKGWGPQMKCQTHDADTVGIDAPNKPPSPARSTWLILAQFDPPTTSARINYKTNLAPQYC